MFLPRILTVAALLALSSCATAPSTVCDRLFFGRDIPGGGEVTDARWKAFETEMITPRYPAGYTIWHGEGHWRGDDGVSIYEQNRVLEVVHDNDAAENAKIEAIAKAYRQRFNQDAVIRVRTPAEETFWRR